MTDEGHDTALHQTARFPDITLRKTARIAGLLFLFTFIFPTITWIFVSSKFIVAGDAIAAANNIIANESLFRIGIITELTRSALAVVFALTLYIILKSVNRDLALLALFLKLTEAILLAVIALGHFVSLLILKGGVSSTFEPGVQALVGLFVNQSFSASAIVMIFHGLNLMVFLYLLFKSRYVPGILAGFGVISYALIFIHALMAIVSQGFASMLIIQIIFWVPSILTELILGSWLLIKGINAQPGREI